MKLLIAFALASAAFGSDKSIARPTAQVAWHYVQDDLGSDIVRVEVFVPYVAADVYLVRLQYEDSGGQVIWTSNLIDNRQHIHWKTAATFRTMFRVGRARVKSIIVDQLQPTVLAVVNAAN